MNYLLYGTEDFLIKKEINKIKESNNITNQDITYFNMEEVPLKEIIDEAATFSLFNNNRLLIVENSYIFTAINKKKQDTTSLENYLKNPNKNNILIFTVITDKLDSRKKIVTLFKENGNVKEFSSNFNLENIVLDMIKPYNISSINLKLLIDRVGKNLNILNQEINKLKTYKDNDFNITKEDIIEVTTETIDTDIFHLVDNIVLKNKEKALKSYYEMIKIGEEPIKIIVILANQFRLIYQVKQLSKKRVSIFDMMSLLGQKKYPIEKALERSKMFSDELLLNYIHKLSELDINIKSGHIDKNIGLELFILES
jgi:DNA polymerase-3 subunit delta